MIPGKEMSGFQSISIYDTRILAESESCFVFDLTQMIDTANRRYNRTPPIPVDC